jgi:hypothetical protein
MHRYWLLTKRLWISVFMAIGMIVSIVAASLVVSPFTCVLILSLTSHNSRSSRSKANNGTRQRPGVRVLHFQQPSATAHAPVSALVHFVAAIITDTLITCLTAYHLYRQKRIVYSITGSLAYLLRCLSLTICSNAKSIRSF